MAVNSLAIIFFLVDYFVVCLHRSSVAKSALQRLSILFNGENLQQLVFGAFGKLCRSYLKIKICIRAEKGLEHQKVHITVPYALMRAEFVVFVVNMYLSYPVFISLKKSEIVLFQTVIRRIHPRDIQRKIQAFFFVYKALHYVSA